MELHAHRETSSPVSEVFPGSHRKTPLDSGLNIGISNTPHTPEPKNHTGKLLLLLRRAVSPIRLIHGSGVRGVARPKSQLSREHFS